jgi:hypothetical protein
MDSSLSFSADAHQKSWLTKKVIPAIQKAIPVVQKVANIAQVIFPNNAVIGKVAQVSNML